MLATIYISGSIRNKHLVYMINRDDDGNIIHKKVNIPDQVVHKPLYVNETTSAIDTLLGAALITDVDPTSDSILVTKMSTNSKLVALSDAGKIISIDKFGLLMIRISERESLRYTPFLSSPELTSPETLIKSQKYETRDGEDIVVSQVVINKRNYNINSYEDRMIMNLGSISSNGNKIFSSDIISDVAAYSIERDNDKFIEVYKGHNSKKVNKDDSVIYHDIGTYLLKIRFGSHDYTPEVQYMPSGHYTNDITIGSINPREPPIRANSVSLGSVDTKHGKKIFLLVLLDNNELFCINFTLYVDVIGDEVITSVEKSVPITISHIGNRYIDLSRMIRHKKRDCTFYAVRRYQGGHILTAIDCSNDIISWVVEKYFDCNALYVSR